MFGKNDIDDSYLNVKKKVNIIIDYINDNINFDKLEKTRSSEVDTPDFLNNIEFMSNGHIDVDKMINKLNSIANGEKLNSVDKTLLLAIIRDIKERIDDAVEKNRKEEIKEYEDQQTEQM